MYEYIECSFYSKLMAYLFIFSANLNIVLIFVFELLQPPFLHFPDKRGIQAIVWVF